MSNGINFDLFIILSWTIAGVVLALLFVMSFYYIWFWSASGQYDLISGTAVPQKGLINETLRRLNVMNADGKLTITQRQ